MKPTENMLPTSPYGGANRFKFIGYNLSPQGTPLVCTAKIIKVFESGAAYFIKTNQTAKMRHPKAAK